MKYSALCVILTLLMAPYAANAEIVISGKTNNQYTQESINSFEKNKALIDSLKIDRESFSDKVNQVCGKEVVDIAYHNFYQLFKELTGQNATDEMIGLENIEMIKTTSVKMCYAGAQEQINGVFDKIYAALLAETKKREAAAVTLQDKAAAGGFALIVKARKMGAEAAK